MKLVANWRQVLTRAWSIRMLIVAGIFQGMEAAIPLLDGYLPIPQRTFASLALLATAAAFVTRIIAQKEFEQ